MTTNAQPAESHEIAVETFGVQVSIEAGSADVLRRLDGVLPPGSVRCARAPEEHRFSITSRNGVSYRVASPGGSVPASSDLDVALEVLESELRMFVASNSPDHVFIHAGVVGHAGRAIVIPGRSFSGKTTLVAELVRAGASYYSDELAALDSEGRVHPYPKPLSIRLQGVSQTDHDVSVLGGTAGTTPLEVGLVVFCEYAPGAAWDPQPVSGGEAVLALIENTFAADARPAKSLQALKHAVDGAIALRGERGEAAPVVQSLLELVR